MTGRPQRRRLLAAAFVSLALAAASGSAQRLEPESWSLVRSSSFTVLSDAGVERAAEIALSLETFRAVFAGLAPDLELRSPAPTVIVAFEDGESFAPYKTVPDRGEARVLGQFLAHRDGNFLALDADPRYLGGFAVVFHEYVHYLVRHNFPGVPLWFNEGLAEYYSTFAIENGRAVVGRPVRRHLSWLARNADLGLRDVLTTTSGLDADPVRAGRLYAVAWGLVHWLLSGGEAAGDALAELLAPAGAGDGDPVDAFERALGAGVGTIERRLRNYLLSPELPVAELAVAAMPAIRTVDVRPAAATEVLVTLGELQARLGQDASAERHFDLALRYEGRDPAALGGLAALRDRQQRAAEARALFEEAIAAGPAASPAWEPTTWLRWGRHLLFTLAERAAAGEDAAAIARRARDAFERALDAEPELAEARAMLGYAHLFGELDAGEGIVHLQRAIEIVPDRADLLLYLVQLRLKNGEPELAAEVIDGPLRRWGDAEMVARASEEVERWSLLTAADAALFEGEPERALELVERAVAATSDPVVRDRLVDRLELLRDRYALP